jgi:hypothetical protein
VVNAIKELSAKVDALVSSNFTYVNEATIGVLNAGKINIQGDVCVDGVCVTKEQFKSIFMQNGATVYITGENQAPTPTPDPTSEPGSVASSTSIEIIEETASTTLDLTAEDPVETAPVEEETDETPVVTP